MQSRSRLSLLVVGVLAATQAFAAEPPGAINTNPAGAPTAFVPSDPTPPSKPALELTTLKLLLAKGTITQEEYDNAIKDSGASASSPTVTVAGWKTTIYGYAELNAGWDSTQSFNEGAGNAAVARPTTFAGSHSRTMMSVRDSRFGFRMAPPTWGDVKVSGVLELDLGGGVGVGNFGAAPGNPSEAGFYVNPVVRIRHAWGKVETPIVDFQFGQTWVLFGFMPGYTPTTGQIPGLTGEIFSRNSQIRISKTIKTDFLNIDLAVAALRPVQRDSALPEGQAALRLSIPKWSGWHSTYINGTSLAPASIAVSGTLRGLAVGAPCTFTAPATTCSSTTTNTVTGSGVAIDAYIPIIPGSKDDKSNSLSLLGEFVTGTSINDLYTGLTGGVGGYAATMKAGTTANGPGLDNGLVVYDRNNNLQQPQWLTSFLGLEYYIPGGRAAVYVNWGHSQLNNAKDMPTATSALRNHSNYYEGGFLVDVTPQIRLAADYVRVVDVYQDGVEAINNCVHGTAFFFF